MQRSGIGSVKGMKKRSEKMRASSSVVLRMTPSRHKAVQADDHVIRLKVAVARWIISYTGSPFPQ